MHVYVLIARPVDQCWRQMAHEGLFLVVLFKSGWLWADAGTRDKSFDFPNGKIPFHSIITGLNLLKVYIYLYLFISKLYLLFKGYYFCPVLDITYRTLIFLKGINHCLLVFFLPMLMLKIYSQNDETGISELLKNEIFFATQPWWEDLYRIF